MNQKSKYFDSIRITSKRQKRVAGSTRPAVGEDPDCQWKGCDKPGNHRAPRGRGAEGEFYHFCVDHVRQYNSSYNYFDGMSDGDVAKFQKDALTGHRPTWKLGANGTAADGTTRHGVNGDGVEGDNSHDPHGFFAWRAQQAREAGKKAKRRLRPLERKSLRVLHLDSNSTKEEIKTRFKELVKQHHPDANGGDSAFEEKLREIIQAYNHLKQSGLA